MPLRPTFSGRLLRISIRFRSAGAAIRFRLRLSRQTCSLVFPWSRCTGPLYSLSFIRPSSSVCTLAVKSLSSTTAPPFNRCFNCSGFSTTVPPQNVSNNRLIWFFTSQKRRSMVLARALRTMAFVILMPSRVNTGGGTNFSVSSQPCHSFLVLRVRWPVPPTSLFRYSRPLST